MTGSRESALWRRVDVAKKAFGAGTADISAALSDGDPSVRAGALIALMRLKQVTLDTLRSSVEDDSPLVRRTVAELAAHFKNFDLNVLLTDTDPLVAEMAAWSAGEQQSTACVPTLIVMCKSHPDPLCREASAAALGAIGDPTGLAAILEAMSDTATVRRRAVIALAAFEGEQVERALTAALADRDWQVRQAAEDLLG